VSRLRVLAVGNLYPPASVGGYEEHWRSAMDRLRELGHAPRVLTTDEPRTAAGGAPASGDVRRELRWYWRDHRFPSIGPRRRLLLERHNAAVFDRHLAELRPDVVNWWSMGGMSLSLIERARRAGVPAVGVVCDDWMHYGPEVDAWSRLFASRPRLAALADRLTSVPTRLDLDAAGSWLFVSDSVRRRALDRWDLSHTGIAHAGVDASLFRPAPERPWRWRLLYAGRIDARKGIDTAIEALGFLPTDATLTIVGSGDESYAEELQALRERLGLERRVELAGPRPRAELAELYADTDAVLFPVRWEEPWGLVPLEAMATGTPVLATRRGGSAEYLVGGENCLDFPAGDAGALAQAVTRLAASEELRRRLRAGGIATAARYGEADCNDVVVAALEEAARS
jgi:glycogen(starch) synthase